MVSKLQPLSNRFQIVNPDGTPTLYMTQWAQQRMEEIGVAVTIEQATEIAQTVVNEFDASHALQAGSGISITPDGRISSDPTISAEVQEILDQITATQGSVLFKGATEWQALAPGTSGYVLQTNGAGADPTWVAQSGGGGGGGGKIYGGLSPPNATVSASAFATKGACITPLKDFAVTELIWQINTITGGEYVAHVLQMNGASTTVVSVMGSSASITTWSVSPNVNLLFEFSSPITLVSGTSYGLVISMTNGGNTYALPLYGAAAAEAVMLGFPAVQGPGCGIAKANPSAGDVNGATIRSPFNLRLGGTNT